MEINQKTSPNFGWKQGVHKNIARKLVQEANQLLPEGKKIESDSFIKTVLDVDKEFGEGRVGQHVADISKRRSDDAIASFEFNRKAAIKAHELGNMPERDNCLARALHFLQDSLCAVHIKLENGTRSKDVRRLHENFEISGNSVINRFVDNPIYLPADKSENTMKIMYNKMLKNNKKLSKSFETESFPMIVDTSLNNTVKMSKMFFDKFLLNIGLK